MIMIFLYLHPDLYNIVSTFFSAYGEVLSVKQTVRNNSVLFQRQATPQVTFVKKKKFARRLIRVIDHDCS